MQNLYLFRKDYSNPGDTWSSPVHYLGDKWEGITLDVDTVHNLEDRQFDNVFIGGGALFTIKNYMNNINETLKTIKFKNLIVWGTGRGLAYNYPFLDQTPNLIGFREWEPDYFSNIIDWVPCASVMHPLIKKYREVNHIKDFLVIDHWKREQIIFPAEHARITNKPQNIESMLEAISKYKWVLTTSYHAAYWATLLNKRVIVLKVETEDNKFRAFKHAPVVSNKFNWELIVSSVNYPDAYEESLTANLNFKSKIYGF